MGCPLHEERYGPRRSKDVLRGPVSSLRPPEVISDRGPQFRAEFTNELARILGIKWKLATAGHSQIAGQLENLNQYINQRIRPFVSHSQDNWSRAIPALDAVQMCLPHKSTRFQPHEVLFGFPMPMPFDWEHRMQKLDGCAPFGADEPARSRGGGSSDSTGKAALSLVVSPVRVQ